MQMLKGHWWRPIRALWKRKFGQFIDSVQEYCLAWGATWRVDDCQIAFQLVFDLFKIERVFIYILYASSLFVRNIILQIENS